MSARDTAEFVVDQFMAFLLKSGLVVQVLNEKDGLVWFDTDMPGWEPHGRYRVPYAAAVGEMKRILEKAPD